MKTIKFPLISFLALLLLPFFSRSLQARELVYVPLPIENQETAITTNAPMIRYLSEKMGISIRIHYEKNYEQILQLFKDGKVDLVQLGPLPFVTLHKEYPSVRPLAIINEAEGKPFYSCALVTSFDGPQSVSAISRPLALPQRLSTCALFAASLILKGHQRDVEEVGYSFVGNHDLVALAVIRGEFETGIIKTQVAKKYHNLALKVMQETPPLPGFMIAGNQATVSEQQLQQIEQLLLQVPSETRTSWILGKDGFSPFSMKDFSLFFDAGS